eukprot:scaffold7968_cov137-Skeletonema_marinoi.AAC.5
MYYSLSAALALARTQHTHKSRSETQSTSDGNSNKTALAHCGVCLSNSDSWVFYYAAGAFDSMQNSSFGQIFVRAR